MEPPWLGALNTTASHSSRPRLIACISFSGAPLLGLPLLSLSPLLLLSMLLGTCEPQLSTCEPQLSTCEMGGVGSTSWCGREGKMRET